MIGSTVVRGIVLFFCLCSQLQAAGPTPEVPTVIMEFFENPISYKYITMVLNDTGMSLPLQKFDLLGTRFTLFAPIDSAFDLFGRLGLLRSKDESVPDPERQKKYVKFAQHHMVKDLLTRKELSNLRRTIKTEAGTQLHPDDIGEILFSVNLRGGIVHVIKKVLINPELQSYLYPPNAPK